VLPSRPCPATWPCDANGGIYAYRGDPRMVSWVETVAADNLRSVLILLGLTLLRDSVRLRVGRRQD
jgi:hypothetical protein